MPWRHSSALVLLIILTSMPAVGTVCAMLCDSAASTETASHHGTDATCEERARSSSGLQISGASEHDCRTHDTSLRHVATTAAERADANAKFARTVVVTTEDPVVILRIPRSLLDYRSPPGSAPPTAQPTVLRV